MISTNIFYLVFISQLFIISYYYPKRLINRIKGVVTNYPENEYPKLYPLGSSKTLMGISIFSVLNMVIFSLGFVLLLNDIYPLFGEKHVHIQSDDFPLFFGMLQLLPFGLLEISSYQQFKLMRAMDTRTKRQADLTPRRLFDYVSPQLLLLAVAAFFGYVIFDLYLNNFSINADILTKTFALVLCNGLFIFLTIKNISGRKQDPFQADKDRIKQIKFSIKSMAYVSIFVSLFILATTIVRHFELHFIELLINSLYFQIVAIFSVGAMLKSLCIEKVDFSVYKNSTKSV